MGTEAPKMQTSNSGVVEAEEGALLPCNVVRQFSLVKCEGASTEPSRIWKKKKCIDTSKVL
jgi:hypothetical protein